MRGRASKNGDTMVSINGYNYTKVDGKWRLTHHIIAETQILGRELNPDERVVFVNGKTNLTPENIRVVKKGRQSLRRRKAQLEARRDEIQAQIDIVDAEIKKQDNMARISSLEQKASELSSTLNA